MIYWNNTRITAILGVVTMLGGLRFLNWKYRDKIRENQIKAKDYKWKWWDYLVMVPIYAYGTWLCLERLILRPLIVIHNTVANHTHGIIRDMLIK